MSYKFSKPGLHHEKDSTKNEDCVVVDKNNRFDVITLCDGVSTCSKSKIGAEIAAQGTTEIFLEAGGFLENFDIEKRTNSILNHIKNKLNIEAVKEDIDIEDMASTVSSVLIDHKTKKLMYFILGDSMLLLKRGNTYEIIVKPTDPHYGCPVTITKRAYRFVETGILDLEDVDACWLFSDGAWNSMLKGSYINENVEKWIINGECDSLSHYLDSLNIHDDYSFAMASC